MGRHKAVFELRYDHFPILIKYNNKQYEIKGTQAGKLLMTKYEKEQDRYLDNSNLEKKND